MLKKAYCVDVLHTEKKVILLILVKLLIKQHYIKQSTILLLAPGTTRPL